MNDNMTFGELRRKWVSVPAADTRLSTESLLSLTDERLLMTWREARQAASTGGAFSVRGWYQLIYRDVLRGKRVMDFGCGLGIDGITLAQHGAHVTFVDIVAANVQLVERIGMLLDLDNVEFHFMDDIHSLTSLSSDYDCIWCQGSMHHAPSGVLRAEARELLCHLPVGGRWIQLAYPKARWEREGGLPFDRWGEQTDGPGTPWAEWYDLTKLLKLLSPARFDVVLHFNFHNDDFNWFDLVRRE